MSTQKMLLLLVLIVGFASCNSDDDMSMNDNDMPTNEIPDNALAFFKGDVDGETVELYVTPTNDISSFSAHDSEGAFQCTIDYGAGIIDQSSNSSGFDFTLLNFYDGNCSEEDEVFSTLFSTGTLPFTVNGNEQAVKCGITLASGYYSTEISTQNDATFSITKITEANNIYGLYQELEGTVSCSLYNIYDPNDVVQLTNGTFKLTVGSYNN